MTATTEAPVARSTGKRAALAQLAELQQHAARMKQLPADHERERKLAPSDFEDARMQLRLYLADVGAGAKKDDRRIGELQDAVGKANLGVQEPWDDMVAGAHLAAMKAKEAVADFIADNFDALAAEQAAKAVASRERIRAAYSELKAALAEKNKLGNEWALLTTHGPDLPPPSLGWTARRRAEKRAEAREMLRKALSLIDEAGVALPMPYALLPEEEREREEAPNG
jgi:hypothetical protein